MLNSFLIPFSAIFLAEFLDKSQLAVLMLGTKTKKHFQLLIGVMFAFILVDGSAILLGSRISNLLPENIVKIISGTLFIIFGILALRDNSSEAKKDIQLKNPLISGLVVVFLSEWGDKTQIASAVFATKYNPIFVFIAVVSAMLLLSLIALKAGSIITKRVSKRKISMISGAVFIILGVLFFLS